MSVTKETIKDEMKHHQSLRAEIYSVEKFLDRNGFRRCPHVCFEEEPGTGIFEVTHPSGWGLVACPVCGDSGWVTQEDWKKYHDRKGHWVAGLGPT